MPAILPTASEKNLLMVKSESVQNMQRKTVSPFSAAILTEHYLHELLTVPNFKA